MCRRERGAQAIWLSSYDRQSGALLYATSQGSTQDSNKDAHIHDIATS
jgi:hypothetical protein